MPNILNHKIIQYIVEQSYRTLSEIGIACSHKHTVTELAQAAHIDYKDGRILFNIEELKENFQKRVGELREAESPDEPPFTMGGHWNSWNLCDPVANRPRPATLGEAVDMARLSETLGTRNTPIPVSPQMDIKRFNTLECERVGLIYTRTLGGRLTATDNDEINILIEMNQAAGRKYTLALEPLISLLKLNAEVMQAYFEWRDCRDLNIEVFGTIPMAGATAPLSFPSALIQALAESIALDFIFDKLSNGELKMFSLRLDPFDMRNMNIVFGSPEWSLFMQTLCELWQDIVGYPLRAGKFRTNSRVVDGQSLVQRTACCMSQAAMGVRHFGAIGQLSVDEVWSPVQAVLDGEILKYVKRLYEGITVDCNPDNSSLDIIREGVSENGFLALEDTINSVRRIYNFDSMFNSVNVDTWTANGSKTAEMLAWEKAQTLIGAYDFILPEDARNNVEQIYNKGRNILINKKR